MSMCDKLKNKTKQNKQTKNRTEQNKTYETSYWLQLEKTLENLVQANLKLLHAFYDGDFHGLDQVGIDIA